MHSKDSVPLDETEQCSAERLARSSGLYRTRARRLGGTEAVILVSETHVPDEMYESAKDQFSDKELVNLTMAVVANQRVEPA